MARLDAPLLSITAAGQCGTGVVYSSWNGRPYAKSLGSPPISNTPAQAAHRLMFSFLAESWLYLADAAKATWNEPANQKRITPANAFLGSNLDRWTRFEMPQQRYHMPVASSPYDLDTYYFTGGKAILDNYVRRNTGYYGWAVILFRHTAPAQTPTKLACVAILRINAASGAAHRDSPVAPGTYYGVARILNADGVLGSIRETAAQTVT